MQMLHSHGSRGSLRSASQPNNIHTARLSLASPGVSPYPSLKKSMKYTPSSSQQPAEQKLNKRFSEDTSKSQHTFLGHNQGTSSRNLQLINQAKSASKSASPQPQYWDHASFENFDVIDRNSLMLMNKKYDLLFRTSNIEVVQKFCKMEPITNFKLI